jgi:transglycosylase-like protein with SLT domain
MTHLVRVMLLSITMATSVYADPLDAALGAGRANLSLDQVAARSERLEASMSFALLRFPEAMQAPGRIFKPEIWNHIEAAARDYNLDPMVLAGMIFIESYGDSQAKSPTGPAGIAQMTRGSAKELGLSVGKRVRVGSRTVTKTRWVGTGKSRRKVVRTVEQPVYKIIDQRYEPARAIFAMARRVSNRRAWLGGKVDFAIAEYHMGAGRMAGLLSAYFGRKIKISEITAEMQSSGLSYAELFWTNTPYDRPEVYQALDELNRVDFSPTYYFRVRQAMRLLATYRQSPAEYTQLASVYQGKFGWDVLPSWQWTFVNEPLTGALPAPPPSGALHKEMNERFVILPDVASTFGVRAADGAMTAERSTIGAALFLAQHLKRLQGDRYTGFEISRMLAPASARCAVSGTSGSDPDSEDDECAPMHTLGWAFDVPSKNLSKTDLRDFRFIVTDLRQAGLLAYVEEGKQPTYHIVRHPDHADEFEQFYWDSMAGTKQPERPRVVAVTGQANDGDAELGERRMPAVLLALTAMLSKIYSYFI